MFSMMPHSPSGFSLSTTQALGEGVRRAETELGISFRASLRFTSPGDGRHLHTGDQVLAHHLGVSR